MDAARTDVEICNNTEMAAWQNEVNAILPAVGSAVDSWAAQSGTNYAHLLDTEMNAWIQGSEADAAAEVVDDEADFNAETDKTVVEAKAADVESDAEDGNAQVAVKIESDAAIADAHDEAQAAVDDSAAVDAAWQTDEHTATADAAAHDNDETAAAVTDANADQSAADTWEQVETPAAAADQKAVDAAEQQAAHAQDAANKTGNDQLATAQKTQQTNDATAAQTRDTTVATVHYANVVAEASAADTAIQAAAASAVQGVQTELQPVPTALNSAANAAIGDFQAQNADLTAKTLDVGNTQRAALLAQVQMQGVANITNAQLKRSTDAARSLDDPEVLMVNPAPPENGYQTFMDYLPSWKTVAIVGLGTAALFIPGAGPILFAASIGMLAASTAYNALDRYYNQNQSGLQSLLGGPADALGVTNLYVGITGRDLVTQRHLGLTDAQERQMLGDSALQIGAMVVTPFAVKAGRSFFRGRQPAVAKPPIEPPATPNAPKPPPVTPEPPAPPPRMSEGSNAGTAGAAEQAQVQTACFVAGTPIRLPFGCKPIEQIRVGDVVLSRDQYNPCGPVVEQVVEEAFVRLAPVIRLTVGSRELRPTGEHPFYVPGRGWVLAWSLRAGDVIHTLSGEPVTVDDMAITGEVVRVYNFRVRELQTYFVGGDDWGFAVWSHNTNGHGMGNIGSHNPVDPSTLLSSAQKWLGAGAREIAPGVFRSADGLRQFRMTTSDLIPTHGNMGSHVHFEALNTAGRVIENLHVPVIP